MLGVPPTIADGDTVVAAGGRLQTTSERGAGLRVQITGAILSLAGTLTALRTQTARDASGNLCLDTVNNAFSAAQTIDAGAGVHALRLGADINTALGTSACLTIDPSTSGTPLIAADFRATNNGPAPIFYKARGLTAAGRTATQATDQLLFLLGSGRGATVDQYNKGGFYIIAATTWTDTNADTQIDFLTTPTGSTTRQVRLTIAQDGNVGIGVVPTASNGLVQLASGTTSASGFACGTDTHWFRDSAGSWSADSNIKVATVGKGLYVKEGTNATMGTGTLVAGSVVISTTKVTATSRIFLTSQADGGTVGFLRVSARTAATSFTITSSSGTDTSTVAWIIMEPA